jgi:prepilin-type processing-associated H-X9-DG protein
MSEPFRKERTMDETPKKKSNVKIILIILACVGGAGLLFLAVLALLLFPAIGAALEQARRAQCAANLKQIGTACQAYAAGHRQNWPTGFAPESTAWDEVGKTRAADGKSDAGPNVAVNSNTASLWVLVKAGLVENQSVFVCPSTEHTPDVSVTNPMKSDVRDFASAACCDYSYENTFSKPAGQDKPYTLTSASSPNLAVAADANPMRRDFYSADPVSDNKKGVTNLQLAAKPTVGDPFNSGKSVPVQGAWELNSPNHAFKGQNVLYLDGHVEFQSTPFAGAKNDNIWIRWVPVSPGSVMMVPKNLDELRATGDTACYDGRTGLPSGSRTDSFLVP